MAVTGACTNKKLYLAAPRGYCAGVDRAVVTVEKALEVYGAPVYVRKQIVHNRHVVETLEGRGAIFVDELDEVPDDALVVFSAHGVSPQVKKEATDRGLRTIDATCPLVTKVHHEAKRFANQDTQILLIGHAGHEEVEGTTGEAPENITLVQTPADVDGLALDRDRPVAWLSQTTLSVDETVETVDRIRDLHPQLIDPPSDDICYATQNRQDAVRELTRECDLVLVVGSPNSSNSNRLRELAEREGVEAHLIDGAAEIDPRWLEGRRHVGVTAGASAPDVLVQGVLERLHELGASSVRELDGEPEDMVFALPRELRIALV